MPELTPYALAFRGALHLGTRGTEAEDAGRYVPADTLFAALLAAWRETGGDVEAFAAPFLGPEPDPPFLLSSAFPYAGGVRFYPVPVDLTRVVTRPAIRERGEEPEGHALPFGGAAAKGPGRGAAGRVPVPRRRSPGARGRSGFAGRRAVADRRGGGAAAARHAAQARETAGVAPSGRVADEPRAAA